MKRSAAIKLVGVGVIACSFVATAAAETTWEKLKRAAAGAAVAAVKGVVRAAQLERVFKTIAKRGLLAGPDREHALTPSAVMAPPGGAKVAAGAVPPVLPKLGVGSSIRNHVDMRKRFGGVRDQGGRNTSAAFALLAAMEFVVNSRDLHLSEQYAYWLMKDAEAAPQRCSGGTSLFHAASILHEKGVPKAGAWPYHTLDLKQPFRKNCFHKQTWSDGKPPAKAKRATKYYLNRYSILPDPTDVATLVTTLDAGHPVVLATGMASTQWHAWLYLNPIIDMQTRNGKPVPATHSHAFVLAGYDLDKKAFLVRNSWGYRWGTKGYHWLAFDYVKQYAEAALYVTEVGTVPAKVDPDFKARAEAEAAGLPVIPVHELETHGRTHKWTMRYPFRPSSIDELSRILKWVHTRLPRATKVKAGGARGSWTQIANSDGVYLIPDGMRSVARVAPAEVRAGSPTPAQLLFRVGAGARLREVNAALWDWGASLPVLPGSDMLTVAGTILTGTHASVLDHGPMADMVRSINLVKVDGSKVRIEPKSGITDAATFPKNHVDSELIQDDDVFDAALINMGTLGIVHSYVVEARPRFWLKEVRTKTTGKKAQELLRKEGVYRLAENPRATPGAQGFAGGHPAPAYYLEMLWNPHSDKLIATSRHPVDEATRARYTRGEPERFKSGPGRDWFLSIFQNAKQHRPQAPGVAAKVYKPIDWLVKQGTKLVPKLISKAVDSALDAMADPDYRHRSYHVFGYSELVNQVPGQATTVTVPLRADLYLRAIDILRETAAEFAKKGVYQTGAISWRFVKGSRAMLAAPEDVCKFEIIFSGIDTAAKKLAEKMAFGYYVALERELGADVRFHFGHRIPDAALPTFQKHLAKSFPRYPAFDRIRRSFDPHDQLMTPWQVKLLPRP